MKKKLILVAALTIAGGARITYAGCAWYDAPCLAREAYEATKKAAKKAASAVAGAAEDVYEYGKEKTTEAYKAVTNLVGNAKATYDTLKDMWDQVQNVRKAEVAAGRSGSLPVTRDIEAVKNNYCPAVPAEKRIPTLKDPEMRSLVKPEILELVEKYSPVLYRHQEDPYYPIKVEEYFTGTTTRVNFYTGPGYAGENDAGHPNLTTVIPKGQVTMTGIYDELYKQADKYKGGRLYFQNDECAKYGSNPAENTDAQGNLTTPNYVRVFEHKDSPGKLYIHYAQTYGLNGPYTIRVPYLKHASSGLVSTLASLFGGLGGGAELLKGDVLDFQNAHEFDLEHITLEFDKATRALERIYFGSHGRDEGYWLPANHPAVEYEDGHPVVYVAHGGHGNYNKAGTFIRVFGIANDVTAKHKRWVPELSIFYEETEPEFRKEWMSWQYHPDSTGRRGVSSYWAKNWAGTDKQQGAKGDEGRPYPYEEILYCPTTELAPADDAARSCIGSKFMDAKAP